MSGDKEEWYIRLEILDGPYGLPRKEYTLTQLFAEDWSDTKSHRASSHRSRSISSGVGKDRIVEGALVIGRQSSSTKDDRHSRGFNSPIVSRNHAQFTVSQRGHVYITDLRSMHGTMVKPCDHEQTLPIYSFQPVQLLDGDILTIGRDISVRERHHTPVRAKIVFRYPLAGVPLNSARDKLHVWSDHTPSYEFATASHRIEILNRVNPHAKYTETRHESQSAHISAYPSDHKEGKAVEKVEVRSVSPTSSLDSPSNDRDQLDICKDGTGNDHDTKRTVYKIPSSMLYPDSDDEDLPRGSEPMSRDRTQSSGRSTHSSLGEQHAVTEISEQVQNIVSKPIPMLYPASSGPATTYQSSEIDIDSKPVELCDNDQNLKEDLKKVHDLGSAASELLAESIELIGSSARVEVKAEDDISVAVDSAQTKDHIMSYTSVDEDQDLSQPGALAQGPVTDGDPSEEPADEKEDEDASSDHEPESERVSDPGEDDDDAEDSDHDEGEECAGSVLGEECDHSVFEEDNEESDHYDEVDYQDGDDYQDEDDYQEDDFHDDDYDYQYCHCRDAEDHVESDDEHNESDLGEENKPDADGVESDARLLETGDKVPKIEPDDDDALSPDVAPNVGASTVQTPVYTGEAAQLTVDPSSEVTASALGVQDIVTSGHNIEPSTLLDICFYYDDQEDGEYQDSDQETSESEDDGDDNMSENGSEDTHDEDHSDGSESSFSDQEEASNHSADSVSVCPRTPEIDSFSSAGDPVSFEPDAIGQFDVQNAILHARLDQVMEALSNDDKASPPSTPSTNGPVTPTSMTKSLKRDVPEEFDVDIRETTPSNKIAKTGEEETAAGIPSQIEPRGGGYARTVGLVALGMALGSVTTIAGLMQLAD